MKKSLLIVAVIIISGCSTVLFSQTLSFGVKGGLNLSNMLEESDYDLWSEDYSYAPGYNAGIWVEVPVSLDLVFEGGISLDTRGYKFESEGTLGSAKVNFNTLYASVPLKVKTIRMAGPVELFAAAGVSAGYGLSGTIDLEMVINNVETSETNDICWGNDPEDCDLKRLDYGALGSVGVGFKGIQLEIAYYHGLANISAYTDDGYVINNRAFSVSLGYKIGF